MKRIVATSLLTALLLATPEALAQTFPATAAWVPITRDGAFVTDPLGDAQGNRDIVGDEAHAAAYVYRDETHLFFRLRVNQDPKQNATNYAPFGWGVAFETDGNFDAYEYLAMLDGISNPDQVALLENTTQATKGNARDSAETVLQTYPPETHARALTADTTFGDDPDYFVDWAIDIADLAAAGFDLSTPIRFIFGTSNNAQTLASDLLTASDSSTIGEIVSDPINCSEGECVACAELCGDACLKCEGATSVCDGSTCVESAPCDGDADCADAALPACQPGGSCGQCSATNQERCATDEMCDVASGECRPGPGTGGCTSDADCSDAAAPACSAAGACEECSASNTTLCSEEEVCDVPNGVCVGKCTDDADCEDPARPACSPKGGCVECSETNQAACDAQDLSCHVPVGNCVHGCASDADCSDSGAPACLSSGVCGECSANNTEACTAEAASCDVELGRCVVPPTDATATFEGSGISCALSPARGALGPALLALLAGLLLFGRRRRTERR